MLHGPARWHRGFGRVARELVFCLQAGAVRYISKATVLAPDAVVSLKVDCADVEALLHCAIPFIGPKQAGFVSLVAVREERTTPSLQIEVPKSSHLHGVSPDVFQILLVGHAKGLIGSWRDRTIETQIAELPSESDVQVLKAAAVIGLCIHPQTMFND